MLYEVKQFKLTNGDELLCEVLDWAEEGQKEIVVRNALCIEPFWDFDNPENGKYYTFRPFMHYNESNEDIIILNSDHVISVSNPPQPLVEQYVKGRAETHETSRSRMESFGNYKRKQFDKLKEAIENLTKKKHSSESEEEPEPPSNVSNVIRFPHTKDSDDIIH
jgi:hypothetical protein